MIVDKLLRDGPSDKSNTKAAIKLRQLKAFIHTIFNIATLFEYNPSKYNNKTRLRLIYKTA